MNNKSIGREMLICQCLSLLPMEDFECPLIDYGKYKLSTKSLLKIFVAAQLDQWGSYAHMEEKLVAYPRLRDFESSDIIMEETDATYVMDRGYPSRKNLMNWQEKELSFVVRITKNLRLYTLEEYESTHPSVIQDAKVLYGSSKIPIRYIEFVDEKERSYRILTTRFDLTNQQVMEIYRNRWIIELFFKWIKQHLKLTKIWSTKPQGIWNQMFLALIAYGLSLIVKLEAKSDKTPWEFFRALQTYLYKTFSSFIKALRLKKKRKSKGRQKVPKPTEKKAPSFGNVALVKEKKQ